MNDDAYEPLLSIVKMLLAMMWNGLPQSSTNSTQKMAPLIPYWAKFDFERQMAPVVIERNEILCSLNKISEKKYIHKSSQPTDECVFVACQSE